MVQTVVTLFSNMWQQIVCVCVCFCVPFYSVFIPKFLRRNSCISLGSNQRAYSQVCLLSFNCIWLSLIFCVFIYLSAKLIRRRFDYGIQCVINVDSVITCSRNAIGCCGRRSWTTDFARPACGRKHWNNKLTDCQPHSYRIVFNCCYASS